MKDTRVLFFRKALEELVDSLDATLRVARWVGPEGVPEPLQESAARLVTRLGTADRLTSSVFKGSPSDCARVDVMLRAMRRLDAAYVAYRKRLELTPSDTDGAAALLDAEIGEVKADPAWRAS